MAADTISSVHIPGFGKVERIVDIEPVTRDVEHADRNATIYQTSQKRRQIRVAQNALKLHRFEFLFYVFGPLVTQLD